MDAPGQSPPAPPSAQPKVKALNCPNCGAALSIRAFENTLSVVCAQCLSVLDAKDPNLRILQQFQAAGRVSLLIPLGARGRLRGDVYEAVGFQVRTITVDGVDYSWHEYLLFNPFKGYRYLTVYNGHWNDVRTVRTIPEQIPGGSKPVVKFLGEKYTHFQTAQARTTFVMGEFPWQVRVGETATVMDFVSPPRMLSAETTEGETVWSLGEYTSGAEIWSAFQLAGRPPAPEGVFANQPSPYAGKSRGIWVACLLLLLALFVIAQAFAIGTSQKEVFRGRYHFSPQGGGEASFVTETFQLDGRPSNVEVTTRTDLSNNWAYFSYALINEQTGQAYDFGREVSYYFGRDSDGSWTEGSAGDRAVIPAVPAGRYYLRVEPEMAPNATAMSYEVTLRRDVPLNGYYWIAALLLIAPPVFSSLRSVSFEQKRWQESDYASSSGSGDDE